MKKALSIIVAAVMLFSTFAIGISAKKSDPSLRFNDDGKFRIMQMADLQDNFSLNPVVKDFLKAAIEKEQPDLIVLTGDNFAGYSTGTNVLGCVDKALAKKAISEYMSIFEQYGVPVTMTFGNHDNEGIKITKEEILELYQEYDCFVGYDAEPELYGCGTHNLPIYSSTNAYKVAYNLWMIDSNTYDEELGGYDYVHDDQVEWYVNKSNELKAANGGQPVPSMAFQHIITQEATQAVMFSLPFQLGAITRNFSDGTSATYLPNYFAFEGLLGEAPCPSLENEGQWDAFVERGDVVACFFGHDHKNNFSVNVDAVSVPGTTFRSYRSVTEQGSLVITLDESDLSSYSTENLYTSDLAVKEGSNIPNQEHSESVINYKFRTFARFLAHGILDVLRALFARIPVPYTVK